MSIEVGAHSTRLLRIAPVVENADLMDALQGAGGRTPLFGVVLTIEIFHRVVFKRDSRIASLL